MDIPIFDVKTRHEVLCKVSDSDYELVKDFKLSYEVIGDNFYRAVIFSNDGRPVHLCRFLLDAKSGEIVDHKNGNTLDNTRKNLRISTIAQNRANTGLSSVNRSGFKGVRQIAGGKWLAQITVNYRQIGLGTYYDPEDAAKVYDVAAIKYFGEFARTNFPKSKLEGVKLPVFKTQTLKCKICKENFSHSGSGTARYCGNCRH